MELHRLQLLIGCISRIVVMVKIENENHLNEGVNYFLDNLSNLNKSIYFSNKEIEKIFDPLYKIIDKNYPLENMK